MPSFCSHVLSTFILFAGFLELFLCSFNVTRDDILSILSMFVILQRLEECNGECIKDGNEACNQMTFVRNCLYVQLSVIVMLCQCIYPSVCT